MPLTRTLLQLRDDARCYADMESSAFVSDAEVTRYINLGCAGLWHVLVQANADRHATDTEITTVGGTYEYALPTDFAAIRKVEKRQTSGSETGWRLEPYNLSEDTEAITGTGLGALTGYESLRYAVLRQGVDGADTRLRMSNDPGAGFLRVWYIQHPVELVDDTDTFDGVAGWEEWAVLWAAEQMMAKEESDPSALIRRRAELTERIKMISADRDIGTAPSVAMVRRRRGRVRYR